MKKRKIILYILPLAICIALIGQSTGYAQHAESIAEVEFVEGMGPTYPVHPENPEIPGNGGGVEGSLAIVCVSRFDFGKMTITSESQFLGITTTMPNIQVIDLRGTAAGWKVSATVSRFNNGSIDTLPGAAIHILNGRPNSNSESLAPTQIPDTLLTTDGVQVEVMSAASGAGAGHWVMCWYPLAAEGKYINLEVPAGLATIGNHNATINWTLENTP